jgi:Uma2 family endonuclease
MSTLASPSPASADVEGRVVLRGVGWDGYVSLLKILGEQPIRVTYDRGDVEIKSPTARHERRKSRLGQFVRVLARELGIPLMPMGSTTWNRQDVDKGLEADESFYLGDLSRILDPDHVDLAIDPPPDLAIEVEVTRSALERIGIFAALGVPEVWRFDGRNLRVLLRQPDGSYRQSETSAAFPNVPMSAPAEFAKKEGIRDENALSDEFVAWVRSEVVKSSDGPAGGV